MAIKSKFNYNNNFFFTKGTYHAVCRANSFTRSISYVEFNKSHVVLRNDVQFSKSTSDLLKTTGTFQNRHVIC